MNGVLVGDIRLRQKCDHLRQYIFKTLGIICAKKKIYALSAIYTGRVSHFLNYKIKQEVYIPVKLSSGFKSKAEMYSSIYKHILYYSIPLFQTSYTFPIQQFLSLRIMTTSDCVSACTAQLDICGSLDFNNVIQKDKHRLIFLYR